MRGEGVNDQGDLEVDIITRRTGVGIWHLEGLELHMLLLSEELVLLEQNALVVGGMSILESVVMVVGHVLY